MIDAYASLRHFADHLAPIWLALPPVQRGTFFAPREILRWASRSTTPFPLALTEGFPDPRSRTPVLVAGFGDHHAVRPRPTVLVNHGAGQSYITRKGAESYSGGPGRERVVLHLEPGTLAAKASAIAGYRYTEVGCPRLDPWHPVPGSRVPGKTVAIAIRQHTPPQTCAEQRSIWPEYEHVMPALAERFDLLGHGHPRGWERTETRWARLGIPFTADSYVVLDQAAVLVTCSSSIGWEFASTGRPVIWCNGSSWRRDAHHGGRFWEPLPGYVVDEAGQLAGAIERALAEPFDPAWWGAVDRVYAHRDGRAAQRAAEAIVTVLADA